MVIALTAAVGSLEAQTYCWFDSRGRSGELASRIPTPKGYFRVAVDSGSFAVWLRQLPLKAENSPVYLYDGSQKRNQNAHCAVVDIDVGDKDLQQCADAVIRLRAEYLYSKKEYDSISFVFTSGDVFPFRKWLEGVRPAVHGNDVIFEVSAIRDSSYSSFRRYLEIIFTYSGSYSLARQMSPEPADNGIAVGDVFIRGGFPGHAVIVIDKAVDTLSGDEIFLLAQSYMPAQEIHVLKNPEKDDLSPWYEAAFGDTLVTPEWIFTRDELRRF